MNLNRVGEVRQENKGKEGVPKKKQTQGFRERGEIGGAEGKGSNLRYGGDPLGNRGGKNGPRFFQGNGKRLKNKIKINLEKTRKNKGKSTCGKNGLATKECGNLVVGQVEQAHVLLPGDLWWSGHREIYNCERKKKKNK